MNNCECNTCKLETLHQLAELPFERFKDITLFEAGVVAFLMSIPMMWAWGLVPTNGIIAFTAGLMLANMTITIMNVIMLGSQGQTIATIRAGYHAKLGHSATHTFMSDLFQKFRPAEWRLLVLSIIPTILWFMFPPTAHPLWMASVAIMFNVVIDRFACATSTAIWRKRDWPCPRCKRPIRPEHQCHSLS